MQNKYRIMQNQYGQYKVQVKGFFGWSDILSDMYLFPFNDTAIFDTKEEAQQIINSLAPKIWRVV